MQTRKSYCLLFFAVLFLRTFLSLLIPITADEAYFIIWAKNLNYGYYDHPPMIGWWLYLLRFVSDNIYWYRSIPLLASALIGYSMYIKYKQQDILKARWISLLFLCAPLNFFSLLVTTDIPLALCSFFAIIFYIEGWKKKYISYFFLSGIFLASALLSKYFAFVLAASLACNFFWQRDYYHSKKLAGFLIIVFLASAAIGLNLFWNYNHDYTNILFNFYNRHGKSEWSWHKVFSYLIIIFYLYLPFIPLQRERYPKSSSTKKILTVFLFFPLLFFLVLSFTKDIGLHWLLSFYPIPFMLFGFYSSIQSIKRSVTWTCCLSLLHVAALFWVLENPYKIKPEENHIIRLAKEPLPFIQTLAPYQNEFAIMTKNYSDSAILSYYLNIYVPVFGIGSKYGRQDDLLTDFKAYQNKNILILKANTYDASDFVPYFEKITLKTLQVEETTYYLVFGYNFQYESYRTQVLSKIKESYYRIPDFFPTPLRSTQ